MALDRRFTGPAHDALWLMGWRWHANLLVAPLGRYNELSVEYDRCELLALRMIHGANLTTHTTAYNGSGVVLPQMVSVWVRGGRR